MVVKSFRGLLADGGQERICLETLRGKVGYRIVKFELFPSSPGASGQQSVVKVYTDSQSTIDGSVNFTDNSLLAVAYYASLISSAEDTAVVTVFDNMVFNQDIYVSHFEDAGAIPINYYLELEVIPLTDHAAEFTTLKDIRGRTDLVAKPAP